MGIIKRAKKKLIIALLLASVGSAGFFGTPHIAKTVVQKLANSEQNMRKVKNTIYCEIDANLRREIKCSILSDALLNLMHRRDQSDRRQQAEKALRDYVKGKFDDGKVKIRAVPPKKWLEHLDWSEYLYELVIDKEVVASFRIRKNRTVKALKIHDNSRFFRALHEIAEREAGGF